MNEVVLVWLCSGLLGSFIFLWFRYLIGENITVRVLLMGILGILFGILTLITILVVLLCILFEICREIMETGKIKKFLNKVIIKGKN